MTANEIRKTWLEFFKNKGHHVEPGSSLIPKNDPTLLWINSGVAALKKYFDGSEIPPSRRIVNSQRSIRTNDIENVGHTARHHTFFEMLGNFSIGDYFRKEAIAFAYEILTSPQYFDLPKDKLYMTYHPSDLDAKKYWIEQGVEESHLIPLEHNFWEIGEGPCGPNTEVFFDRGGKYDPNHQGIKLLEDEIENDRYIEIWGIVFSQYNAVSGVKREDYKELPSKNIDTGAGLERLACIIQGTESNFETDLFLPLIQKVEEMSNIKYKNNTLAYRVIVDHIRAVTFALADGEMFSNEGRGYVLRRLLRRAERYGRVLGIDKPFLYLLVPTVTKIMEDYYPYLIEKEAFISKMIKAEEEKFIKTLQNGEELLKDLINKNHSLSGKDMFKLYDTFGFPKELTIEICEEAGVPIDIEGFNIEMEAQKQRARMARGDLQSMSRQSKDLLDFVTPSEFLYDLKPIEAKVIGLFINGERVTSLNGEGEVIFDRSNFYAESGGQVSDTGFIKNETTALKVSNVKKAPNKQHLHSVSVLYGEVKEGDTFTLTIDENRRLQIMRNHSSVHLLQSALIKVLGDHIAQHGSYVNDEYVHFDFTHFEKIKEEDLLEVERLVNSWISEAIEQKTFVLPIEEAKKMGAKALFDDKYGEMVRVVTFGDISKEFCGGTHVKNSEDIGLFAIEFEESIASGIRRIQARTSIHAYQLLKQREALLRKLTSSLGTSSIFESNQRLNALLNERNELKKNNECLTQKIARVTAEGLLNAVVNKNGISYLVYKVNKADRSSLLAIIDSLKQNLSDYVILLIGDSNNTLPIVCSVSGKALEKYKAGSIVKIISQALDGSGGGRNDLASGAGKNKDKLPVAINIFKELYE